MEPSRQKDLPTARRSGGARPSSKNESKVKTGGNTGTVAKLLARAHDDSFLIGTESACMSAHIVLPIKHP